MVGWVNCPKYAVCFSISFLLFLNDNLLLRLKLTFFWLLYQMQRPSLRDYNFIAGSSGQRMSETAWVYLPREIATLNLQGCSKSHFCRNFVASVARCLGMQSGSWRHNLITHVFTFSVFGLCVVDLALPPNFESFIRFCFRWHRPRFEFKSSIFLLRQIVCRVANCRDRNWASARRCTWTPAIFHARRGGGEIN
jgi:hypothetical protein